MTPLTTAQEYATKGRSTLRQYAATHVKNGNQLAKLASTIHLANELF